MASQNDMKAHKETFSGVMTFLKFGTIAVSLVAILVVVLISN